MFSDLFACKCCSRYSFLDSIVVMKKKEQICRSKSTDEEPSRRTYLEKLEEKELVLKKRISREIERAKGFIESKNPRAALQCLKRKKYYEGQIEQLRRFQLLISNYVQSNKYI